MVRIQPQLTFDGNCEEALEFYKDALNAEIRKVERYEHRLRWEHDSRKIRHAELWIGNDRIIMSDQLEGLVIGNNISLTVESEEESCRLIFAKLSQFGEILLEFGETDLGEKTGIVKDRFSIHWFIVARRAE